MPYSPPLSGDEPFRLHDVAGMVDIEHLRERPGFKPASVGDKRPLEISHAALATADTSLQCPDGHGSKSVDTTGDIAASLRAVEKCGDVHPVGRLDVERLLVVYIVGDAHHAVGLSTVHGFAERTDVAGELVFAEDGVDSGQTERPSPSILLIS